MRGLKPSFCGSLFAEAQKPTTEQILLAYIGDKVANLVWMLSDDGAKRVNKPKSMLSLILGEDYEDADESLNGYDSPEEFWEAYKNYE